MTYHIGQIVRHEPRITALTGHKLDEPVWHILGVMSGQEERQADRLALAGVHTAYPTREVTWRDARGQTVTQVRADVPGWVFAKFRHAPNWHEMRARRIICRLVCKQTQFGPVPYAASEDDVRVFMGLPTVAEEIEAARREALRVKPGDQARVVVGENLSLVVTVRDVIGGRVFWDHGAMKGDTAEARCERIAC
ncbi:transcription termination/antitermination protein NusG [Sagittula sp. S175]|uniref:transcription termination/antitermination protein NusG n=1 Tax=Sagittula sp. S175 TaxID=3415129 RepID=UPI003C7ABA6D